MNCMHSTNCLWNCQAVHLQWHRQQWQAWKVRRVVLVQARESRNVAYVAMTRAERVLYLSHVGPPEAANSFFTEAMLPGAVVTDI